jgi:hypothetical protein
VEVEAAVAAVVVVVRPSPLYYYFVCRWDSGFFFFLPRFLSLLTRA